ncbi:hypothetical protein CLOM_g394 [Closterium sp. NIES-68]|nr:hypothetical protein CLOM_g394 [Closterium sp. NIES-68]
MRFPSSRHRAAGGPHRLHRNARLGVQCSRLLLACAGIIVPLVVSYSAFNSSSTSRSSSSKENEEDKIRLLAAEAWRRTRGIR